MLAGEEGIRLSLAGAQDKVAMRVECGEVCLPLGGAPGTHILKPAVERHDRIHKRGPDGVPVLERLHQEDFCQALGLVPEHKYQREGGPSLKRCSGLLREVSGAPVIDLTRLLEAVICNYLVGNNDTHGKNFSLLYRSVGTADPEIRLAPLYDVVSKTRMIDKINAICNFRTFC